MFFPVTHSHGYRITKETTWGWLGKTTMGCGLCYFQITWLWLSEATYKVVQVSPISSLGWWMEVISIVFMGIINQHSHHYGGTTKKTTQVHGSQAAVRNSAHQQCWAFVFLLIYSGQGIPVHFGSFTQPCHWLKRLHLVIRWGKICFLVILQCSQTICFSGWSRHWKSWYFFSRSTRHDINSLGGHGQIVWRHIHCWIIECTPWLILWWPFVFSYVFNFWGSQALSVRHALSILWVPATELSTDDGFLITGRVNCLTWWVTCSHSRTLSAPPKTPPKKQQCKNQECLASYKKKLIACARVRCKRRVDSVAASPREYLVRRAAKNVISPPKTPPKPPPRNNNAKIKSVLQVTRRSW